MTDQPASDRPPPLERLREGPLPPSALEDRVVASLRARGAFGPSPGRRSPARYWGVLLAASVAAFLIGRSVRPGPTATPAAGAPRWMLLLYEDETFEGPAPGREADYVAEYRRWAERLREQGAFVDGAELVRGGGLLEKAGQPLGLESPVPGAGALTGYFIVAAPDIERASALAATSPHLGHRGRIAIRPLGPS